MISNQGTTLLLFRHSPLTVLNFVQNDRNAHMILPPFVMSICDFTPHLELDIYIVMLTKMITFDQIYLAQLAIISIQI